MFRHMFVGFRNDYIIIGAWPMTSHSNTRNWQIHNIREAASPRGESPLAILIPRNNMQQQSEPFLILTTPVACRISIITLWAQIHAQQSCMVTVTLHLISFLMSRFLPLYVKMTWTFLVPGPQMSGPGCGRREEGKTDHCLHQTYNVPCKESITIATHAWCHVKSSQYIRLCKWLSKTSLSCTDKPCSSQCS